MKMREVETRVGIRRMQLNCYIGVEDTERRSQQTVYIDVRCMPARPAVDNDSIMHTIDYRPIREKILLLGAPSKNRKLIETLAREIGEICLSDEKVVTAEVNVSKKHIFPDVEEVYTTRFFTRV